MIPACDAEFMPIDFDRVRHCNLEEGHDGPHQVVAGWKHPEVLATGPPRLHVVEATVQPSNQEGESGE